MRQSIPETMQAMRLETEGGPLVAREVPVPTPGPKQVLVRMAASVINPSDISFIQGRSAGQQVLPVTPGGEGCGTVVAAGEGILARFMLGKRVACAKPSTGDGAWAEYMLCQASRCIPLGRAVTMEQGATLLVNPMTAIGFLELIRRGRHQAVVNTAAASQLGRMMVRLLAKRNTPLINIVRRLEQAEMLRGIGAQHVLNSSDPDFDCQLSELARQLNATLILDAVGGALTQRLVDASPPGSSIVLYANLSRQPATIVPNSLYNHDRRIEGFYLGVWSAKQGMLRMLMAGRQAQELAGSDLSTSFQQRLPFTQAQEALELYRKDMTAGKILLVMSQQ